MLFSNSVKIKCESTEINYSKLQDIVFSEFKRISDNCFNNDNQISAAGINTTFGSILRNDTTTVRINAANDGCEYLIDTETIYKPSVFFWIFFIIDILLIETVIGFIAGMGITLGLYFYNKKIVVDEINSALKNLKNKLE